jgi:uncharacterized membrane protein YfcA
MSLDTTLALAVAILFASTFVRSALGFGDALVAMPLLVLTVGVRTATPVVAFAASTIAVVILLSHWRRVDVRATWRLVVASLVGIPFGLLLLKAAPEAYVKIVLGVLLILYGLYSLLAPRLPELKSERTAYVFGFVAGVLGGAYNTNGPPVVVYAALRRWPPEHFRATLQGCFLLTGLMILIGHGLAGLWTPMVLSLYLYALPAILLAVFLGERVNRRIPRETFSRAVYVFLIIMGALFLIMP